MTKVNHRRKNKERKPYTKSKAFSTGCRNHGSCKYCESNRLHKHRKQLIEDNNNE